MSAESATVKMMPGSNPRGIPQAPFVTNIEEYLKDESPQTALTKFQEMLAKYKYMESHLGQRSTSLESKIPEIKKTIETVTMLISKKEKDLHFRTLYEIEDSLFAKADVEPLENVYLWLGANVMLEYPTEEAKALLESKLSSAEESIEQVREDLEFIREQITTMEVNTARIYNYDVKLKRTPVA